MKRGSDRRTAGQRPRCFHPSPSPPGGFALVAHSERDQVPNRVARSRTVQDGVQFPYDPAAGRMLKPGGNGEVRSREQPAEAGVASRLLLALVGVGGALGGR
jgi:hypothetical protein